MEITDVRIKKIESENRLKAIASITFDNCLVIHDVRVIEGDNGVFIAMPSKKIPTGEFKDIAHPITSEFRKVLEEVIIKAYNEL